MRLGSGIFMWDSPERQSQRYGYFYLSDVNFHGTATVNPHFDLLTAQTFLGKKVKLWAQIIETRQSGHAGDQFIGIFPETPEIGDIINLGVGYFDLQKNPITPGI